MTFTQNGVCGTHIVFQKNRIQGIISEILRWVSLLGEKFVFLNSLGTTKISTIFKLSVYNIGHKSFETYFNCAFTYLFGHIVTKEKQPRGVSFRCCRIAAEETNMYTWTRLKITNVSFGSCLTSAIKNCLQLMIFGGTVQHCMKEGKEISKTLSDKIMYIGTMTGCKKIRDIYAKHGSKEDLAKLHAVAKAPKASPMKALRDFQRQQFGTPPIGMLLAWCSLPQNFALYRVQQ